MNNSYKVFRNIGVPIFKILYRPTILNKEYIPKEGPIILCGNHLHVLDQFPVICSTDRVTHWMAKKEYFDGNLGWFFKKTGAICVDRFGDASQAEREALEYLFKGEAIGIFPEGTRNQYENVKINLEKVKNKIIETENKYQTGKIKKDEYLSCIGNLQNEYIRLEKGLEEAKRIVESKGNKIIETEELLPFKFGAVSMAKKADATIVPFGVTGDYEFGSRNLIVNFGEPFKVEEDLENANKKLRTSVLKLVRENRKM